MHRLLLAALSAAAAAAVPQQSDNASDRRALQAGVDLASICAADISGAARGVPTKASTNARPSITAHSAV